MMRSQSDSASRFKPGCKKSHAGFDVGRSQPALLGGIVVIAADSTDAAIERGLRCFDDRHRNPGIEEIHRYAAAHGAGADDADLFDRQCWRVVGHVGDLPHLAFGKEHVTLRLRLRRGNEIKKSLTLELHALVERKFDGVLHGAHGDLPGLEAAIFAGIFVADLVENLRVAPRRFDLVVEVADPAQRHLRVDDFARKRNRAFAQFSLFDERIDDAPFQRLLRAEWRAGKDRFKRGLYSAQTRQALRAAGAWNETKFNLGKAEFRRWHRNAVMAHQRHFKTAAKRCAVHGGNDRLRTAFKCGLQFRQRRAFGGLAEFGNVGAGDKRAAGANHDDGFDGGVGAGLLDSVAKTVANFRRKRIDGR